MLHWRNRFSLSGRSCSLNQERSNRPGGACQELLCDPSKAKWGGDWSSQRILPG
ncbi:hypothetical protein ACRRTK_015022 [Alexandromys fortis]